MIWRVLLVEDCADCPFARGSNGQELLNFGLLGFTGNGLYGHVLLVVVGADVQVLEFEYPDVLPVFLFLAPLAVIIVLSLPHFGILRLILPHLILTTLLALPPLFGVLRLRLLQAVAVQFFALPLRRCEAFGGHCHAGAQRVGAGPQRQGEEVE